MPGAFRFMLFGLITVFFAQRKGYNPLCWILSGGLIGLAVVAFLPNAKKMTADEKTKKTKRMQGNIIGSVLSATTILLSLALNYMLMAAR